VVWGTSKACHSVDETRMGNQGASRPTWPQENQQENSGGVGGPLRRRLVSGSLAGWRQAHSGQYPLACGDAIALVSSTITPTRTRKGWETQALRRHHESGHQAWHPGYTPTL